MRSQLLGIPSPDQCSGVLLIEDDLPDCLIRPLNVLVITRYEEYRERSSFLRYEESSFSPQHRDGKSLSRVLFLGTAPVQRVYGRSERFSFRHKSSPT
jgi:hypothetical protein